MRPGGRRLGRVMKTEVIDEFLTLVRCRGFNRAARELYLSQSTLSTHIASLERELGVSLIDRGAEGFALSDAGKAFLAYAQNISTLVEDARQAVKEASQSCVPAVRVPADFYVMGSVRRVFDKHGISLVPVDGDMGETTLDAIAAHRIDFGWMPDVTSDADLMRWAEAQSVSFVPLLGCRRALACSKENPLSRVANPMREDLRGATILLGSLAWFELEKRAILDSLGHDLDLRFVLRPMENVTEYAFADLGDVIVSCSNVSIEKRYLERDDMVVIDRLDGLPIVNERALLAYRSGKGSALTDAIMEEVASGLQSES